MDPDKTDIVIQCSMGALDSMPRFIMRISRIKSDLIHLWRNENIGYSLLVPLYLPLSLVYHPMIE